MDAHIEFSGEYHSHGTRFIGAWVSDGPIALIEVKDLSDESVYCTRLDLDKAHFIDGLTTRFDPAVLHELIDEIHRQQRVFAIEGTFE